MRGPKNCLISQLNNLISVLVVLCCHSQGQFLDPDLCPNECMCKNKTLRDVFSQYNQKHSVLRGSEYRSEKAGNSPKNYADVFGEWSHYMVSEIVEINCLLQGKKQYTVTELLNETHRTHYTSLEVKCKSNEPTWVIWDIPPWETNVNIFVNEHCKIRSDENQTIKFPVNMWILENYGGKRSQDVVELKHGMNMIALVLAESSLDVVTKLPSNLEHIQIVSYNSNHLKDFRCEHLSSLTHLDTLNIGDNELTEFPECLANPERTDVSYLSLAHNSISNISVLFEKKIQTIIDPDLGPVEVKRSQIMILDLSNNEIANLGVFDNLPKLTSLDLSNNYIRKIDQSYFKNLPNLEWLSLSHNRIHALYDNAFTLNPRLRNIDLSRNEIENLHPSVLPANVTGVHLDIRGNRLRYPLLFKCMDEKGYEGLNSIRLYGSGNPYNCDCQALEFEKCVSSLRKAGKLSSIPDLNQFQCHSPREIRGMRFPQASLKTKCVTEEGCPFGCSCHVIKEKTLLVNCSSRHLMEVPDHVPTIEKDQKIVMLLNHNPIHLLGYRPYFPQVSELYIHNCLLTAITSSAMEALKGAQVLALHKNMLKKLPPTTQNLTLKDLRNLTLHGNRWSCECNQLWMSPWLKSVRAALFAPTRIQCAFTRTPLIQLSEADVKCGETDYVDMVLVTLIVTATLMSTLYVIYYYRCEINQLLYIKFGLRLWDAFKYGDVYCVYDAFVFYSQNNYKWVVDTLLVRLEGGAIRYKLCLHFRDFPKDEIAVDNVPLAINLSRCSLLLLSRDFLENEWQIANLRTAFQRYLFGTNSLIIVLTDDIHPDELTPDLAAYMASHEVLYINDANFWQKLEYFLPPPRFISETPTKEDATELDTEMGDGFPKKKSSGTTNGSLNSETLEGPRKRRGQEPQQVSEPLDTKDTTTETADVTLTKDMADTADSGDLRAHGDYTTTVQTGDKDT